MSNPIYMPATERYEVPNDKWICCHRVRRGQFCPDCGKRKPERQWSSRIDDLIALWEKEKYTCEKTAQTFNDRITRCEVALERVSEAQTIDDVMSAMAYAKVRPYSDYSEGELERAKESSKHHLECEVSNYSGNVKTNLRKADQRGYWIDTVKEVLAMIPQGNPK